jgi:hypothetical protein
MKLGRCGLLVAPYIVFMLYFGWGIFQSVHKAKISGFVLGLSGSGQDDYFEPYFMKSSFKPREILKKIQDLLKESPKKIFVDSAADYPTIILYGRFYGIDNDLWLFDRPHRKLESIGGIDECYIIAGGDAQVETIKKRFNIRETNLVEDLGYYKIYVGKSR